MGFQQGLSGLNTSSKSLDVIGNNIANASTVGFKNGQAQFADVFAASLQGAGSLPVGLVRWLPSCSSSRRATLLHEQSAGHRYQRRRVLPHERPGRR